MTIQQMINNIHEIIFQCDNQGSITFLNQSWERLLGYPKEETLGHSIVEFVYPEDKKTIFTSIIKESKHEELRLYDISGNLLWFELSVSQKETDDNIGVLYNITSRKLLEIKRSEELNTTFAILDGLPGFVFLMDNEYTIIYCNKFFKDYFGDGTGCFCYQNLPCQCGPKIAKNCPSNSVLTTKVPKIWEWENKKDGKIYQIYDYLFQHENKVLLLKLGIDITKQKEAEKGREKLIISLEKALDTIKTLRGFVPICASCKKIRDDKGYWNQVEQYIEEHTEAVFTHGICPDCKDKILKAQQIWD